MSASPVAPARTDALTALFGKPRGVLIGVVHLLPLPGSPEHRGESVEAITQRALADARAYAEAGMDGLIVENHGDVPFLKPDAIGPETAAVMAVAAREVRIATGLPVGINVLANAAIPALAVAVAAGAGFIRVNQWANAYVANEGLIEGDAARTLRYRKALGAETVRIFADSHVKHGAHAITADRSVGELTRDLEWSLADAVIATGQRTGDAADPAEIRAVREATVLPVLVGSGVTPANVGTILAQAEGVIVASALKADGVWWNPVDRARARAFVAAARKS
jgi:membrane complex biogenesis BtpA family protein